LVEGPRHEFVDLRSWVASGDSLQRCREIRDPQAWLTDVLSRITEHKITKLDELMPWNYIPEG